MSQALATNLDCHMNPVEFRVWTYRDADQRVAATAGGIPAVGKVAPNGAIVVLKEVRATHVAKWWNPLSWLWAWGLGEIMLDGVEWKVTVDYEYRSEDCVVE